MNQKKDAKTIVFAVKMFSYWARNVFWYLEKFPFDLMIPVDSRLENLYKKYNWTWTKKEIKDYYINLSKKLNIPPLHLDAILWVDYERFIK
jgi:DNA-(apurinic or apyrimidinic site) lyase